MRPLAVAFALVAMLSGCEESRRLPDGTVASCKGLNTQEDSSLVYEYSTRNIVVGVLAAETVIVPVVVALKELRCPVSRR